MTEDAGVRAALDDIQARTFAQVTAVEQDPHTRAFVHNQLSESCEAPVAPIEAAGAHLIGAVVHRQHHPEPQPRERLDPVEVGANPVTILGGEEQAAPAFAFQPRDVRCRANHHEAGMPAGDQVPRHQARECGVEARERVPRGDGVGRDAVPMGDGHVGVGPHLHAGIDEYVGMVAVEHRVGAARAGPWRLSRLHRARFPICGPCVQACPRGGRRCAGAHQVDHELSTVALHRAPPGDRCIMHRLGAGASACGTSAASADFSLVPSAKTAIINAVPEPVAIVSVNIGDCARGVPYTAPLNRGDHHAFLARDRRRCSACRARTRHRSAGRRGVQGPPDAVAVSRLLHQ